MCGIAGMSPPLDKKLTKRMCDSLIHRGPDSDGYYEDSGASLGVRRLRIIDLVTGDQPIHNEDGTIWVVFNGEIYNYRELREELGQHGHDFYTETDTEVLVHGYESFGLGLLQRLRGMFAFAIWDSAHKTLFLARDRFGKKPLYYRVLDHRLFFSSEMKSILRYEEMPNDLNNAALAHYLTYFYNPLDESFIQGIYRLLPAHYLVWDPAHYEMSVKQYWDLPIRDKSPGVSLKDAMDSLDGALRDAVRVRMKSDVPLGVLLSGGVDSSVITGIASALKEDLQTFSIVHGGRDSEGKYSKQVSELFGTNHHEYEVHVDSLKLLAEIAGRLDEPFGDSSIIPTYVVSQEARRHVTVCLTGDGGDEMFWGYPWLNNRGMLGAWFKLPRHIRKPLRTFMANFPSTVSEAFRDLGRYEDLDYGSCSRELQCVLRLSHYPAQEVASVVGVDYHVYESYLGVMRIGNDLDRARAYLTIKKVLPNDFLYKVDRASMLHSLEVRSPLLDHVLAELVWPWPSYLKVGGGVSKSVLKEYATKRLHVPRDVIYRGKVGFSVPTSNWFRDARNELFNNVNALDRVVGKQILERIGKERPSYEQSNRVIALLVLSLWLRAESPNCKESISHSERRSVG